MTPPEKRGPDTGPGAKPDLEPELGAFAAFEGLDPMGFVEAWAKATAAAGQNPAGVMEAWSRYWSGIMEASTAAIDRATGEEKAGPVQPGRRDRRFRDPAWEENPAFFGLLQSYLLASRLVEDLRGASSVDSATDERLGFLSDVLMDAMAPTNFLDQPGRPEAGLRHRGCERRARLRDLPRRPGPQQRPAAPGRRQRLRGGPQSRGDARQGRVPQRADGAHPVRAADRAGARPPLLCSPPWINKYYVMDLAPGRSFVEWAVAARPHGRSRSAT